MLMMSSKSGKVFPTSQRTMSSSPLKYLINYKAATALTLHESRRLGSLMEVDSAMFWRVTRLSPLE